VTENYDLIFALVPGNILPILKKKYANLYLGQELQPLTLLQYQKPTFDTTNVCLVYGKGVVLVYGKLFLQTLGHIVLIFFVATYKVFGQILCIHVLGPSTTTSVFA
jgi:hypothetical protein